MTSSYLVVVDGPVDPTADDVALMLTSPECYRTSEYLVTVTKVEVGAFALLVRRMAESSPADWPWLRAAAQDLTGHSA